jgi:MFS family permease
MGTARWLTRPFLLLTLFYFLVFAAGYQIVPVMPFRLRELGATLAQSGRFMAAFQLGSGLGALFTGPLGDRLGKDRVLRAAALLSAAFFLSYAWLRLPWVFFVLAFAHGIVWSALRTNALAKVGGLLPETRRAEALALFGLASPGGVAVGPMMGLQLYRWMGFTLHMVLLAAAFIALQRLGHALPEDTARPEAPKGLQWPQRAVWIPAVTMVLLALSYGPMGPYSAQEAKAAGVKWDGAFLTCFGLGMLSLRFVLGLRGLGQRPVALLPRMILLTLLGSALMAILPGTLVRHILAGLVYGAGYAMVHTLVFMHILETTPAETRGAAVGAMYFSYDAGVAMGAILVGLLMDRAGFRWGWWSGTAALLLSLLPARRLVTQHLHHRGMLES